MTPEQIDRHRRVSEELTEVRTVLSRARTGIAKLDAYDRLRTTMDYYRNRPVDPATADIRADLEQVVELLGKYEKLGVKELKRLS